MEKSTLEILGSLLQAKVLFPWLLGMLFGIFVGATPGLTATMAVALIVPISFYMPDPSTGLAMIIGVSFTAIFAGDIPATYLRIPGTPASAAATLDGHQMSRQGMGGLALTLDLFCSSLGGLFGVLMLIFLAPQLARFALRFSDYEYFWLALLGLSLSAVVSHGSTMKGLLAAGLGMLLATIGIDVVSGAPRYAFSQVNLMGGLEFIPVMIGLFGLSEVFRGVRDRWNLATSSVAGATRGQPLAALRIIWLRKWTVLQSSIAGTVIGALPGAGADIAAWGAYGLAQRTSKEGSRFGTGAEEGVVAPTSANNAAVAGAWIPALVFGIPGDAVTAIVLGAMLMYDLKPGPLIFQQSADQVKAIFLIALVTQGLLLPCGLLGIRAFGWILRLPRSIILVGVVVFSVVGSFAYQNNLFDVYVMIIFGLVGFFLEAQRVPLAPLILGLILGPMVEDNWRTGLIKSGGDWLPFFLRPICVVLFLILLISLAAPALVRGWNRIGGRVRRVELPPE